tara:strand:+ start:3037 stop:3171 length:135 start_codon:yes stop_codon:yes gene_type:complete
MTTIASDRFGYIQENSTGAGNAASDVLIHCDDRKVERKTLYVNA